MNISISQTQPSFEAPVQKGWFIGAGEIFNRVLPRHETRDDIVEELIGATFTIGRYALTAFPMANRARQGKAFVAHGMAAIIGDVADGVFTRALSEKMLGREAEDTPFRRILDGSLDQVTVLQVGYEIAKRNPSAVPYLGIIGMRSLIAGGGLNGVHMIATGEVTKGKKWQKACNISAGIFGIAASTGNKKATHATGVIASAIAISTAPKHLKEFRERRGRVFREL